MTWACASHAILFVGSSMEIPTLDIVVQDALTLFEKGVPGFPTVPFSRPLIIGSANALEVGRILFRDVPAVYASEVTWERTADLYAPDGAVLISASGSKHATGIAAALSARGLQTILITHTVDAPASRSLSPEQVYVFPKNREPYTYNTSTYLGLVAAKEQSDVPVVRSALEAALAGLPAVDATAYTFVVPHTYSLITYMVRTKFDELFGTALPGRVFHDEEFKHAKSVVTTDSELYVFFGDADDRVLYESARRVRVPLSEGSYLAALAVTYSVVGRIQAVSSPHFSKQLPTYTERASAVFNTVINPIVD